MQQDGSIPGYTSDCDATWVGWVSYADGGWSCWRGEKLHKNEQKSFVTTHQKKIDVNAIVSKIHLSHSTRMFDKYRVSSFLQMASHYDKPG